MSNTNRRQAVTRGEHLNGGSNEDERGQATENADKKTLSLMESPTEELYALSGSKKVKVYSETNMKSDTDLLEFAHMNQNTSIPRRMEGILSAHIPLPMPKNWMQVEKLKLKQKEMLKQHGFLKELSEIGEVEKVQPCNKDLSNSSESACFKYSADMCDTEDSSDESLESGTSESDISGALFIDTDKYEVESDGEEETEDLNNDTEVQQKIMSRMKQEDVLDASIEKDVCRNMKYDKDTYCSPDLCLLTASKINDSLQSAIANVKGYDEKQLYSVESCISMTKTSWDQTVTRKSDTHSTSVTSDSASTLDSQRKCEDTTEMVSSKSKLQSQYPGSPILGKQEENQISESHHLGKLDEAKSKVCLMNVSLSRSAMENGQILKCCQEKDLISMGADSESDTDNYSSYSDTCVDDKYSSDFEMVPGTKELLPHTEIVKTKQMLDSNSRDSDLHQQQKNLMSKPVQQLLRSAQMTDHSLSTNREVCSAEIGTLKTEIEYMRKGHCKTTKSHLASHNSENCINSECFQNSEGPKTLEYIVKGPAPRRPEAWPLQSPLLSCLSKPDCGGMTSESQRAVTEVRTLTGSVRNTAKYNQSSGFSNGKILIHHLPYRIQISILFFFAE